MAARPIFGEGVFTVSPGYIWYIITFEYEDPEREYWRALEAGAQGEIERSLKDEMQRLMDEERVIVNGKEVRVEVLVARISHRGKAELSSVTFISLIRYEPRAGINVYENFYEATRAEYDYVVSWVVDGEITRVDSPGEVKVEGHKASIRVRKGQKIPGYESVSFKLKG